MINIAEIKIALETAQRCRRNWDLSKTIPQEHIDLLKYSVINSPAKQNEEYYLTPKYIRDMFISLWDSTVFKHTVASGSNIEYIGVDSGLADDLSQKPNRDLEINKILIGMRKPF